MSRIVTRALALALACALPVGAEEIDYKKLYARVAPGVVLIYGEEGKVGWAIAPTRVKRTDEYPSIPPQILGLRLKKTRPQTKTNCNAKTNNEPRIPRCSHRSRRLLLSSPRLVHGAQWIDGGQGGHGGLLVLRVM